MEKSENCSVLYVYFYLKLCVCVMCLGGEIKENIYEYILVDKSILFRTIRFAAFLCHPIHLSCNCISYLEINTDMNWLLCFYLYIV